MARQIVLFLVLVLVSSCKHEKQDYVYLELNNKELESEITKYIKFTEVKENQPFIIQVFCMEVNDSTTRYVISSEIVPAMVKACPYHFVCKVAGRDIFFTMLAGISRYNWIKGNFFKLKESSYLNFMQKNFPQDYKLYIQKKHKGYEVLYEPDMYYLTFVNEKIVKKEVRMGLPWY
jgi:hypothetical protein